MTVLLFGNYIKDYPRVTTMRRGFELNNVEVLECQTRKKGFAKYIDLFKQHRRIKGKYDVLMVMMGGQKLVLMIKILTKKKIVFDAFVSLYLSEVVDRGLTGRKTKRAKKLRRWDKWPCQLSDMVLLDTEAQIDYFVNEYNLSRGRFLKLPVTCDNKIFYPQNIERSDDKFIVHWHGYIVPFHGVGVILQAAKILQLESDIEFEIVTRFDSKYQKIKKQAEDLELDNVSFVEEKSYQEISDRINLADISLGVFGRNKKAEVVVPNKIIEAIACKKTVITGRTKAVQETFEDNKNILLVNLEDSKDLSDKILELKNNSVKRRRIEEAGYEVFQDKLRQERVMKGLIKMLTY